MTGPRSAATTSEPATAAVAPVTRGALDALISRAQAQHDGIVVAREVFAAYVLARVSPGTPLGALHVEDLYLACAGVGGDARALEALDRRLVDEVVAVVQRLAARAELADQVAQRLRARLLTGEARRPPRIVAYAGRGPLATWLRAAATRLTVRLTRDRRRAEARAAGTAPRPRRKRPSLDARWLAPLEAAFRAAFGELPATDRLVLRLRLKERTSVPRIAGLLGTSRAAADGRIQAARDELRRHTLRRLADELGGPPAARARLLAALRSQLERSLAALVARV